MPPWRPGTVSGGSYTGAMSRTAPVALPPVRSVGLDRPFDWLRRGARDLRRVGLLSLAHGLALSLFGGLIGWVAHERFWLMAGALSGFLVVAPVLATSLYALSRALEHGERPGLGVVLRTWTNWQRGNNKWGHDYWCLVRFGLLLALAGTGWVLTSAALITLYAPQPITTPADFLRHVVLADENLLFETWLLMGGVLAAPIFASSVVAMPLLLDRRVRLWQAVYTSWQTVLDNPLPLALWAVLILVLTVLGLATGLVGLIVVMPLLGHASWHAYRDLVDTSALPLRERSAGGGAGPR